MEHQVVLIRHATTTDTRAGLFSGRCATPLDQPGQRQAEAIARRLAGRQWGEVLVSPVARAWETAERAGLAHAATPSDALAEWDYGELVGQASNEVRGARPSWDLFVDGAPGGERPAQVVARLQPLIDTLDAARHDVVVVSHGHLLRALIATWIDLGLDRAGQLDIDPASISMLTHRRGRRVLSVLNDRSHLEDVG